MRRTFWIICAAIACFVVSSVQVDTCLAQFLPYGYGGFPYGGWGAAQTMATAQRQTAIYNNYQANRRQSLQTNALQHYNTNQFLLQQSQRMNPQAGTRQASVDWMMKRQPTRAW